LPAYSGQVKPGMVKLHLGKCLVLGIQYFLSDEYTTEHISAYKIIPTSTTRKPVDL